MLTPQVILKPAVHQASVCPLLPGRPDGLGEPAGKSILPNERLQNNIRFGVKPRNKTSPLQEVAERVGEISDMRSLAELARWDQYTKSMPTASEPVRATQLGSIDGFQNGMVRKLTEPLKRFRTLLRESKSDDALHNALLRFWTVENDQARKIPESTVKALATATGNGYGVWERAKIANRYKDFAPALAQIIGIKREIARVFGGSPGKLYNVMLQQYEPGATTQQLDKLFGTLKQELVPMVSQIGMARKGEAEDFAFLDKPVASDKVWSFCRQILDDMGFEMDKGQVGRSPHPFCSFIAPPNDVRIAIDEEKPNPTVRDFLVQFFSTVHEAGHAVVEQGASPKLLRTGLTGGTMAIHESQSRLWENMVGRSLPFWKHYYPKLQAVFPEQLHDVPLMTFYKAINQVQPSPVRVDADEVTYNLHVMLRYALEKDLMNAQPREVYAKIRDLPKAWNAQMQDLLKIQPKNDAEGVLQDVHWSQGWVGYFPSYALGNLGAAQIYKAAEKAIDRKHGAGYLNKCLEAGDLKTLKSWLQQKIYQHGQIYLPDETIRRVTGKPLSTEDYMDYLWKKYAAIYPIHRETVKDAPAKAH